VSSRIDVGQAELRPLVMVNRLARRLASRIALDVPIGQCYAKRHGLNGGGTVNHV
jgi:hypothetical protein